MERECFKREALNALIRKSKNEFREEACLGLMQMLGTLQVMSKASSQGSKVGEQAEVANPHRDRILKGNEKTVGKKRGQHSRPRKDGYQQQAKSSLEKDVETILAKGVIKRHMVPHVQEYLVRWKGLPR